MQEVLRRVRNWALAVTVLFAVVGGGWYWVSGQPTAGWQLTAAKTCFVVAFAAFVVGAYCSVHIEDEHTGHGPPH